MKYDVIIVGAGVAGLYCAAHLPKNLKVLILCKAQPWECNTFYAQGGITIAKGESDIESHINDTLEAGSRANDPATVRLVSESSLAILDELTRGGFPIDRTKSGEIAYAKEGGHAIARIIHANGDGTGRLLHTHLICNLQHTLWKNAQVIDLLMEDSRVYGVCVKTNSEILNLYANHIVLASGGVGGLFKYHTNAYTISSDLQGVILEHNLALRDMEMLQFHPTVYVEGAHARKPLISEAVRGDGGIIVDSAGRRFLLDYDPRGELAPRDIVSRAIFDYCNGAGGEKGAESGGKKCGEIIRESGEEKRPERHEGFKRHGGAFLDLSAFSAEGFRTRFPNIFRQLSSCGLRIPRDKIPISPAFHYAMGGIAVDLSAKVLGTENLYAIGECANNGLHGANRLASNSLLEGLVFGKIAAQNIAESSLSTSQRHFPLNREPLVKEGDERLKNVLREIMWSKVGIARTQSGLDSALGGVEVMLLGEIGRLLRLRLLVARKIITAALARKNSLGAHYRVD